MIGLHAFFLQGDLLSRTDTAPVDAKLQELKKRKDPICKESIEPEEKLTSKKPPICETHIAMDSSKSIKVNKVGNSSIDFPTPSSTTEAVAQSISVNPRQNGSFMPADLVQGFPDSTGNAKPKAVGVIGGQLAGSSKSSLQSSPRSSDDSSKILSGPIQPPVSSLNQTPLHHISTPGSQITSSSLHQPVFPSFGSDSQPPLSSQSSRINQLLQQQPIAQIRPGDTTHKLPSSLFPQPAILPSVAGAASTVAKEPAFIPTALPSNPNPAPQQSKLYKWTQSIPMDAKETPSPIVGQAERDNTRTGVSTTSETASTSITPIGGPVTVDPVSAKWGVIAAPRLSPTPSEFKPGVQWKPKAELERDDKRSSQVDDAKELTEQEKDPKILQDSGTNGRPLPPTDRLPSAGIIRPPPGLSTANKFETHSKTVDPQVAVLEGTVDQGTTKLPSRHWLSLSGLKQTVGLLQWFFISFFIF